MQSIVAYKGCRLACAGRGSLREILLLGEPAALAMPLRDDGPALRADQVRPADRVAALLLLRFGVGIAPHGLLTAHKPLSLPSLLSIFIPNDPVCLSPPSWLPMRAGAGYLYCGMRYRFEVRLTEADVGRRVVIRWRRPVAGDGAEIADVLGILEAADAACFTVRKASGEVVSIPRERALAGKTVPQPPPRREPRA